MNMLYKDSLDHITPVYLGCEYVAVNAQQYQLKYEIPYLSTLPHFD